MTTAKLNVKKKRCFNLVIVVVAIVIIFAVVVAAVVVVVVVAVIVIVVIVIVVVFAVVCSPRNSLRQSAIAEAFAKVKSVSLYSLRQHNCRSENLILTKHFSQIQKRF